MRQASILIRDWLETLPPGTTFTSRDVCEAVNPSYYSGLRSLEATNLLRNIEGVRKEGKKGKLTCYVWEGSS